VIRVLGIDPGSRVTGFGAVEGDAARARYLGSGCIRAGQGTVTARLRAVFEGVEALLVEFAPDCVVVESVFVRRNVGSALTLGQARGAVLTAVARAGAPLAEYAPARIKLAVAGSGRAAKEQVQFMVVQRLQLAARPQSDAADALAAALCHLVTGTGYAGVRP
jgi:crossover junction endodeoxyribonuclease RuvC